MWSAISWMARLVGGVAAIFATISFVLELCGVKISITSVGVSVGIIFAAVALANIPWLLVVKMLSEFFPGTGRLQDGIATFGMPISTIIAVVSAVVVLVTTNLEQLLERSENGPLLLLLGLFGVVIIVFSWLMKPIWEADSKKARDEAVPGVMDPRVRLEAMRSRRGRPRWNIYLNGKLVGRLDAVKYFASHITMYYPYLFDASTGKYHCGEGLANQVEAVAALVQQVEWGRTRWPLPLRKQGVSVPYPPDWLS